MEQTSQQDLKIFNFEITEKELPLLITAIESVPLQGSMKMVGITYLGLQGLLDKLKNLQQVNETK